MGKGGVLLGKATMRAPSPSSPEHAAEEFYVNRSTAGDYASKPSIEKWLPDQRERFEAELARLEAENRTGADQAVLEAGRRSDAEFERRAPREGS